MFRKGHFWHLSFIILFCNQAVAVQNIPHIKIKEYADIYKDLTNIPELLEATILKTNADSTLVEALWSVRNIPRKNKLKLLKNYIVKKGNIEKTAPSLQRNVVMKAHHDGGDWTATVMQSEDLQQIVFTQSSTDRFSYIDLKGLGIHGKIFSDPMLSDVLSWSPDAKRVAYVAEKRKPKSPSFFSPNLDSSAEDSVGDEFIYYDDWGENMDGQHQSVVAVVDVKTQEVKLLDIPEGLSPGQLQWVSNDALIGVAYITDPYRLGLVYCGMRESIMFQYSISSGQYKEITERGRYVLTPRVSPDRKKVVYLTGEAGGEHTKNSQALMLNLDDNAIKVVIDYVKRSRKTQNGEDFYGVDSSTFLPRRCWSEDSSKILFNALSPFFEKSYVLDHETLEISEISHNSQQNLRIKDVKNNWVLFLTSSRTQPDQLLLAKLPDEDSTKLQWDFIALANQSSVLPDSWRDHWSFESPVPHPNPSYSDLPVSVIYLGPKDVNEGREKRPLIVLPHGGPHSISEDRYSLHTAFLLQLGYSIILPNYRGSLGQGKDSVESLPGHIGTADVQDVYQSIQETLKRYEGIVDESNIFLFGSSHGGFLSLSLSAQYPGLFRAASLRNPVADVFALVSSSDIPDWAYIESGFEYNTTKIASIEEMVRMRKISPISTIKRNAVPSAFFLGSKDRRLPYFQGLHYHKLLLAQGTPTRAFVYDDDHGIDKVENEANFLMNSIKWFKQYQETNLEDQSFI